MSRRRRFDDVLEKFFQLLVRNDPHSFDIDGDGCDDARRE
jgi:hypothetical protein